MTATLLSLLGGLALLIAGGELLVSGAARLALRFGIPPLVIGLTVVAFGTSAPELVVTLDAAWQGGGAADLALGNVVGSNIFNVLFILGLCALIAPLTVGLRMIRIEVPLMIAASALLLWFARDGIINRIEGGLLFIALAAYVAFTLRYARAAAQAEKAAGETPASTAPAGMPGQLLRIIGGLMMLVLGAHWLVGGATDVARIMGLSETIIGLTIVAAGTSMPEVAASIMATVRGQRDMAVGNVIGSNLFNILAVTGLAALIAPHGIPAATSIRAFDGPVMLAVAIACLPIFFTGYRIARWEGGVFLGYYIAYVGYLILGATAHDSLDTYSHIMMLFVVPLTLLTLGLSLYRALFHTPRQTER